MEPRRELGTLLDGPLLTKALAATVAGFAGLFAAGCGGSAGAGPAPPTAPSPPSETVTVIYRDATNGSSVNGSVTYTNTSGRPATAVTGTAVTLLAGTRFSIDAPGYSRKETDAQSLVDGAYWGIPEALQTQVDLARGNGGLRRPGLDKSFDVEIDRLTFTRPQRDAIQALMEATAPIVTAGRYRWTFIMRDDPGPSPGVYAVVIAGAGTFTPFLVGDEIVGGKVGIDPSAPGSPRFQNMVRQASARMVGFSADSFNEDTRIYLALTRLPIGNRAPNIDP